MTTYLKISTGEPFKGEIPTEVVLPESTQEGDILVTRAVTYRQGEPGWEEALHRWFFLEGYGPEEDVLPKGAAKGLLRVKGKWKRQDDSRLASPSA